MVIYFVGHVVQKVQPRKVYTPVRSSRLQQQLPKTFAGKIWGHLASCDTLWSGLMGEVLLLFHGQTCKSKIMILDNLYVDFLFL